MDIIDTPFNTTSKLPCLAATVGTVIRYYNFSNSASFPEKCLTLAEAQAIAAQGLLSAVVFQQRQNQVGDFSNVKGLAAGRRAYQLAQNTISQPPGSGIYFSVDFDATSTEITGAVIPYFEGVQQAFDEESGGAPQYRVGAYGSGLVCGNLTLRGLISLTWLAMSRGFAGTKAALDAGEYHLAQRPPATTLCGIGVDFNDVNPARPDFGSFALTDQGPEHGTIPPAADRFRVIARSGLRLREGPGAEFDIIGGLPFGQIVVVTSIADGWARVDVEGDGKVDGFASAGFLEKV